MRQMQVNDPGVSMMQQRKEKAKDCVKRVWGQEGFRGFYRGFLAYGVVHLFMGVLMMQMNMRSGYFTEQQ